MQSAAADSAIGRQARPTGPDFASTLMTTVISTADITSTIVASILIPLCFVAATFAVFWLDAKSKNSG